MGRTKTWDGGAHGSIGKNLPLWFYLKINPTTSHPSLFPVCNISLNPQIAVVWQIVSGSREFGLVFYFLSHAARQGVIIEKLMAWKLGSIYPARLPVNCKSSGKSQLPLWPSLHGKIENSGSSDIKGALQLEKSRIPDKCESKKLVLGKPEMQLSVEELQLERELSSLRAWRCGRLYNSDCKGVSFYCGKQHKIWANRLANYPWLWNKLPRLERMLASVPHS